MFFSFFRQSSPQHPSLSPVRFIVLQTFSPDHSLLFLIFNFLPGDIPSHCSLGAKEGTVNFTPYEKPPCSYCRFNGDGFRLSLELTNFDIDCSCYQFVIKENLGNPSRPITKYCGRAKRISFLAIRAAGVDEFGLERFCNET